VEVGVLAQLGTKYYWREVDVVADVFVRIRELATAEAEGRASRDVASSVDDADLAVEQFAKVCNYDFIMRFKSSSGSGEEHKPARRQKPEDTNEYKMRDQGIMPLGVGWDEEAEAEVVYVLVDRDKRIREKSPFISGNTKDFLMKLLRKGHHVRCIVLLAVPHDVFNRAINYLYYQVEIPTDSARERGRREPLPIGSQGEDDPAEIAKARYWLRDALDRRASDVHFEPGDPIGRVRMRIDGELVEALDAVPDAVHRQIVTWIQTQARMNISERRIPQDGRLQLAYDIADGGPGTRARHVKLIDVRISTIPTVDGQKMVMRLLDPEGLRKLAAGGLGNTIWDDVQQESFRDVLEMRDGIVLVTGPTGCGKTTTLNAGLYHLLNIYESRRNIVTIEDPVEYSVQGVNQIQVDTRAGMTFDRALRSIVRQDPDIVLVGEIRDPETAKIAVQAALTGHLILTTLHTNDALGAVDRLRDLEVSPFLIGSTVRMFQAQRLVRCLCERCRERGRLEGEELSRKLGASRLAPYADRLEGPGATVYDSVGCAACEHTGYTNRMAVMEMARTKPELIAAIEDKAVAETLRRVARDNCGFHPMVESGVELIRRGVTSLAEVESIGMHEVHADGSDSDD